MPHSVAVNQNYGPFGLKVLQSDNDYAELTIYGDIGENWYDDESTSARDFVNTLNDLDVSKIDLRINSYGGSVADGLAIYNAIRRHKATVDVHIDGVAMSMASYIAQAGDTRHMAENAVMMIHAPWSYAIGNSAEMRKTADMLDQFAIAMVSGYEKNSALTAEEVNALLTDGDDHYYTAAECEEMQLVDVVTEALQIAASFKRPDGRFNTLPAAAAAFFKTPEQEGTKMPKQAKTSAAGTEPQAPKTDEAAIAAAKADAMAAEGKRKQSIRAIFKNFMQHDGVQDLLDTCIDDHTIDKHQAQDKLLASLGNGAEPVGGAVIVQDAREKFVVGAGAALAFKAGVTTERDRSNEFVGFSLVELARAALHQANISTAGMNKMELVGQAFASHSTSDFSSLLADVAHKSMLKGYEEAEETFQLWTTPGVATDFKPQNRVDLNSFPSLDKVPEGAEYKYGTIGDRGETVTLATYGKKFSITRQAVINDDLSAFTRVPNKMGRAAIRTIGDLVYAILTGNPVMSDGTVLFHADHNNVGTGGAINTASVDAMRVLLAKQTDGGDNAAALNIRLANLLVPVALEGAAKVVRDSEFEVGASTKNNTTPNSVRGTFEVISDARLDADSAAKWYGAANSAMHDTIEVSYLDGNDAPYMEQQNGWNVDGAEFKVRIDAAATPLDFRTMAYNAGA